jgi:hypothetical protein
VALKREEGAMSQGKQALLEGEAKMMGSAPEPSEGTQPQAVLQRSML